MHSIGGALGAFPLTLLVSFFYGEMPDAYNSLMHGQIVGPMGESYGPLAVVSVFSLLFAMKPYFLHKLIFNTSAFDYFIENIVCYFLVLVVSVIFVEIKSDMSSTKNASLLISAFAYFLFYNASINAVRVSIL